MDRLTTLLTHFSLRAGVFHTGNICGVHDFREDAHRGHLHLVRRGPVQLAGASEGIVDIVEPTLVFLPRPGDHRIIADDRSGADVVCATVQFAGGDPNPVTGSLPSVMCVALTALPRVEVLVGLMFEEASNARCGHQAALDRLCEVLMIQLLRHCLDRGIATTGTLAGLADSRIARAMVAVHADPSRDWSLVELANIAGMSRARFAVHFREVTRQTPADYIASWRIMMAQQLLRKGLQLKHVAYDVGYGSATALARAFSRKLGCSPSEWLDVSRERLPSDNPERTVG